jgi:PKD repeat protein
VTFTNTSQNATSYSWNFGDGSTSTATNPSHTFTTGGTFTVQLTATGTGGSNTTSQTVNILAPPTKCWLKKVTITAMPFTDGSGAGWDTYNGPDVFIEITDANNTVYQTGTTVSDVTSSMLPLIWNWSTPWQFPSLTTDYYVDLTDYDTPDPNDYIGWCGPFKMSTYTTYPTTMSKTANGITVTIEVQWGN